MSFAGNKNLFKIRFMEICAGFRHRRPTLNTHEDQCSGEHNPVLPRRSELSQYRGYNTLRLT
jgi:hypothetical protein